MPKFVAIVALPSELPREIWNRDEPLIYSGVGKLNAAIATLESINKYRPEFILNLGTVGSIRNDISGVIEIEKVFQRDFDATPLVPKGVVPFDEKPHVFSADFGQYKCGSGDTFVREREEWLIKNSIDVVDMELFGIAHACYSKNISWRSFKYITDYVSINSGNDWRNNLEKSGSALIKAIDFISS